MPIYEFRCLDCANMYEILAFTREDGEATICPKCGSPSTQKIVSTFAVSTSGSGSDLPSCADSGCGAGCGHGHCDFDDD